MHARPGVDARRLATAARWLQLVTNTNCLTACPARWLTGQRSCLDEKFSLCKSCMYHCLSVYLSLYIYLSSQVVQRMYLVSLLDRAHGQPLYCPPRVTNQTHTHTHTHAETGEPRPHPTADAHTRPLPRDLSDVPPQRPIMRPRGKSTCMSVGEGGGVPEQPAKPAAAKARGQHTNLGDVEILVGGHAHVNAPNHPLCVTPPPPETRSSTARSRPS